MFGFNKKIEISDKHMSEEEKVIFRELMLKVHEYGILKNQAFSEFDQSKKQKEIKDAIKLIDEALEIRAFPGFVFDKAILLSLSENEGAAKAENSRFFIMMDIWSKQKPNNIDRELIKLYDLNKMKKVAWQSIQKT